ncbi:Transcriptional regulator, GntR family domain / Aspartate aminotransferase [plant metagenome]|uniref:Transcriptional regulator, GntR family domain / Aspartate aminotransferase n=1 Tax=plant metagenome TaxID=1297885 RepID=A0A484UNH4_9ZZZZ
MKRYEALAEDIAQSMRQGVLAPGDRLPSVRQASKQRGVSPSTVFQAYYLLEARGLIRARARSGYYVLGHAAVWPPEPDDTLPAAGSRAGAEIGHAASVEVSDRVFDVLEASRAPGVAPLGSAFPEPGLFPLQRLGRLLAHAGQRMDPASTLDDLSPGNARLRRQIALRYLADGLTVHPDEIVITNGALEALNLCLSAVTRPGDTVLLESPTFYAALQALERNGLHAVEVPTHPREGMDLAALAQALAQHRPAACWLMTNFQNPLGSLMPEAKKRELVALLARHGVPLIEDDVYGELYFSVRRPLPAKAYDSQGLVMHCGSFSKCLAPGYRVGWAAPGRFTRAVTRLKFSTTLGSCAPAQAALAAYLEKGGYDRHLRRLRDTLAARQQPFVQAVARHFPEGTRATRPEGGYFLWLELPAGVDALTLHRHALAQGISVAPGPIFSAQDRYRHCLRLNYGHADGALDAVETLGRMAHALAGQATRRPA